MRMSERPHEASRLEGGIQVPGNLEAVQGFEKQTNGHKAEE